MYRVGKEETEAVSRVIVGGSYFKTGNIYNETEQAETEMKKLFGVKNALVMTSGMAALVSGLTALGIGPGNQVIVPAYTYIATAMAVVAVGAIPVIAECDETLTIDPEDIKKKITPATRAIIPVHIQGFPCNMDAICAIAKEHNLKIIEDACQADGGKYHGKRLGTIGDAGALSFNQYKLISTGEGGALLTNDNLLYQRALIYHDSNAVAFFGDQMKDVQEELFCGAEYRTNEILSAMLREQLKRMDPMIESLRSVKKRVMDELKNECSFIPSNDAEGDLATTVAFAFDTPEKADKFAEAKGGIVPINTGKHIYKHWTAIIEKRGAYNPLMDPFKMEANKGIIPDYTEDMCPKTLEILARTVYVGINPDMKDERIEQLINDCREILKTL